jgi:hypothetical protein
VQGTVIKVSVTSDVAMRQTLKNLSKLCSLASWMLHQHLLCLQADIKDVKGYAIQIGRHQDELQVSNRTYVLANAL